MNTLSGYSKKTLSENYLLTANGGHLYQQDLMSDFSGGTITSTDNSLNITATTLTVGGKSIPLPEQTVDIINSLSITLDTDLKLKITANGIEAKSDSTIKASVLESYAKHGTSYSSYVIETNTYNKGVRFEFIKPSSIGLTNVGDYCGLMHYRPYGNSNDFSGGGPFLIAFFPENNKLLFRGSTATTSSSNGSATWNNWNVVANILDITTALNTLNKSDNPINKYYVSSVTLTNGIIDVSRTPFPSIEDLGGISPDNVTANINTALQSVYWANLKLGTSANTNTKPTFATIITSTILSLENLELLLKSTNSIIGLGANLVNGHNPPIDLGTIEKPWKNLYLKNGINFGNSLFINPMYDVRGYHELQFKSDTLLFLNISSEEIPSLLTFINPGHTESYKLDEAPLIKTISLVNNNTVSFILLDDISVPESGNLIFTLPKASLHLNNAQKVDNPGFDGGLTFISNLTVIYEISIGGQTIETTVESNHTHSATISFTSLEYFEKNELKLDLKIDLKIGAINGNYVSYLNLTYYIDMLSSVTCEFEEAIKLEILYDTLYNKTNHLLLYKNGLCFVGDKSAIYFGENWFQVHLGKLILELGYYEHEVAKDSIYLKYSKDGGHTYTDF